MCAGSPAIPCWWPPRTAFTPDNDGINETFGPITECALRTYLFRIFDRWGRMLWESADPTERWTKEADVSGVFVWTLEYAWEGDVEDTQKEFGHVVVLR